MEIEEKDNKMKLEKQKYKEKVEQLHNKIQQFKITMDQEDEDLASSNKILERIESIQGRT